MGLLLMLIFMVEVSGILGEIFTRWAGVCSLCVLLAKVSLLVIVEFTMHRCVAQPGSALRSGRRGRRFESSYTDQTPLQYLPFDS